MSFLDTIDKARQQLEKLGRISLRALQREFDLDEGMLEELVEELVDVHCVAVRDGKVLVHKNAPSASAAPVSETPVREAPVGDLSPRDYTPKHLADKILKTKSALEGERKQVTVLFADVKGSMELAEQVDPEQWHHILDGFLHILADGVHRATPKR
jgi:hypothetical protein